MTLALPKVKERRPANDLVVATRMPPPPRTRTGYVFADVGDLVAHCMQEGCGYHVQGTRTDVGLALKEHHRMFHAHEISVVHLNDPRQ